MNTQSPCFFDEMADHIIADIAQFVLGDGDSVPVVRYLLRFSGTCRRIHDITTSPDSPYLQDIWSALPTNPPDILEISQQTHFWGLVIRFNKAQTKLDLSGMNCLFYIVMHKTTTSPVSFQSSGRYICDEGARHIADALKTNKTLTVLNLSCK